MKTKWVTNPHIEFVVAESLFSNLFYLLNPLTSLLDNFTVPMELVVQSRDGQKGGPSNVTPV